MSEQTIAVYGATGFTGQLVAKELADRRIDVVIGGRNEPKLKRLSEQLGEMGSVPTVVVADADAPEQLDAMLSGTDVLINCAGPFVDVSKPVVQAALRTATNYLDTTGEQPFIRWIATDCDDDARRREITLMPACAFEYALGDLGSEIALEKAASRIVVAYAVPDFKMSHGTKKSVLRMLASGGWTYRDGQHRRESTGYRLFDVPMPDGDKQKALWIAGGEAITVPRRGGVSRVETCVVSPGPVAGLAGKIAGKVPGLLRAIQPVADRLAEKTDGDPHRAQHDPPEFTVVVFDPDTGQPHVTLKGVDPYATTSRIITEAAVRMLGDDPIRSGFVGPADLFEPRAFLEAVGVEVVEPEQMDTSDHPADSVRH